MKTHYLLILLIFSVLIAFIFAIINKDTETKQKVVSSENDKNYKLLHIIKRKDVDDRIYTQGLFLSDDGKFLYQSGGLYEKSSLTKMKFPSLEIVEEYRLPKDFFGEGIAICNNKIYQMTWREKKMLIYSYPEMEFIKTIDMPKEMKEGWGLSQGKKTNELYATDGSEFIYSYSCDKEELDFINKTEINTEEGRKVMNLNDLIYVDGYIYANIYTTALIIKINPETGTVVQWYNMRPLVKYEIDSRTLQVNNYSDGDVLNGICYNKVKKSFLITGKRWGFIYEVVLK